MKNNAKDVLLKKNPLREPAEIYRLFRYLAWNFIVTMKMIRSLAAVRLQL